VNELAKKMDYRAYDDDGGVHGGDAVFHGDDDEVETLVNVKFLERQAGSCRDLLAMQGHSQISWADHSSSNGVMVVACLGLVPSRETPCLSFLSENVLSHRPRLSSEVLSCQGTMVRVP
jgi:hypothetical protein